MNSAGGSIEKAILRMLGAAMLIDGFLTLLFGHRFVRLFRFEPEHNLLSRVVNWFLAWPPWLLRGGAAGQAALGTALLGRAPLSVEELYGKLAGAYAAIDPGWRSWFYPQAHTAFDRAISRYLPRGGAVLDLGSGVGANLSRLLELNLPFGEYVGVDLTSEMLAPARERYGGQSKVRFQRLDLATGPLPEGPFDLITSTWVLEHLADPVKLAHRAWDRLKPGGPMVLLFEVEAGSPPSRLGGRLYPFFSARLVPEEEVRALPGLISTQCFEGPLGVLALVILARPRLEGNP